MYVSPFDWIFSLNATAPLYSSDLLLPLLASLCLDARSISSARPCGVGGRRFSIESAVWGK
jgi:hypothetical protein